MNYVNQADRPTMFMNQPVKSGYLYGLCNGFNFIAEPVIVVGRGQIPLIWWNSTERKWRNDSMTVITRKTKAIAEPKLPPQSMLPDPNVVELVQIATLRANTTKAIDQPVNPLRMIQKYLRECWKCGAIKLTEMTSGVKPYPVPKPAYTVDLDSDELRREAANPSVVRKSKGNPVRHSLPKTSRQYDDYSLRIYGYEVEMNGKFVPVEGRIAQYLDGKGYSNCKNAIGNDSYRVAETVFPVKSGRTVSSGKSFKADKNWKYTKQQ